MANRVGRVAVALEDELLQCCARVHPAPDVLARIGQLVREPLDWDAVLSRSWWHRIRPLTFHHLRAQPDGVIPHSALLQLAEQAAELSMRNRRLSAALRDVASMFERSQLRALVFKGPTLAEDVYGDLRLRECGDLDLLVAERDFTNVESMLRSNGFASWWDRAQPNRQVFACEFERPDATLDVHWQLAPGWLNYRVDFEPLWSRGLPLDGGSWFRKLMPEDSISVLSIHGTKHWWERLRWICDVAELINSGQIADWNGVRESAVSMRSLRSVYLGLWLAKHVLGAQVPAEIVNELRRAPGIERLGAQVRTWLAAAPGSGESRKLHERFRFRLGVCERRRDCLPQIVHYLLARPGDRAE